MGLLVLIIIIAVIWIIIAGKSEKQPEPAKESKLNIDNEEFLIADGRLYEYRGKRDSVRIPKGVTWIFNHEYPISSQTINTICIPRTVLGIGDTALPYVETVLYEGSESEWNQLIIAEGNFKTGWCPSWCRNDPVMKNYRVEKVSFHYNCGYQWDT